MAPPTPTKVAAAIKKLCSTDQAVMHAHVRGLNSTIDKLKSRQIAPPDPVALSHGPVGVSAIILESRSWTKFHADPNPLLQYLADGNRCGKEKKRAGWLREAEAALRGVDATAEGGEQRKTHLSGADNVALVQIKVEIERVVMARPLPEGSQPIADLCHAYGVGQQKVRHCVENYLRNNLSFDRKRRADAGMPNKNNSRSRRRAGDDESGDQQGSNF